MKIGILIGRFQVPEPHEGHVFLINSILERVDKLIILIGSSNKARSVKNPYTYRERINAISRHYGWSESRIEFAPINDYMYNDAQWMADVAATIEEMIFQVKGNELTQITMFGHFKEGNSYLKWFPQFKYENIDSEIEVSGTEMRSANRHLLPQVIQEEYTQYEHDKYLFSNYPYPDCLQANCGDVVLECLGHVALVLRPNGVWALPGGHKHNHETFLDCALRELNEETNVKIPEKVLRGSIKTTRLFDHPGRSNGFVKKVTLAVHIVVQPNPDGSMPKMAGADDVTDAKWVPISTAINKYRLHDDHGDIISIMTNVHPLMAIHNMSITYGN